MVHPVRPPLAKGRVRHAGEPVAVVIAADRYTAADAAAAVEVSYNPLPAVITPEAALADGAPTIHEELDSNVGLVLAHKTDGVDEAFANAEVVVKHTIRNQRLIHVPIETRGVVADWNTASDELVVHSSTQVPHFLRTFLAIVCGVSEAKVRAIAPEVGGGFGSKLNAYAEEFIAAAASRKVGAPVKWIEERSEAMLATCHGRGAGRHDGAGRDEGRQGARDAGALRPGLRLLPPDADAAHLAAHAAHVAAARTPSRRSTSPSRTSTRTPCRPTRCAAPAGRRRPTPSSG